MSIAVGCVTGDVDNFDVSIAKPSTTRPRPTPNQIDHSLFSLPESTLCDRLREIEHIDSRAPEESDKLYKAIIQNGSEAFPCLIEHYVVGDTVLFTVLQILSQRDDEHW